MSRIEIRELLSKDVDMLTLILKENAFKPYRFFPEKFHHELLEFVRNDIIELAEDENCKVLIGFVGGKIAGTLAYNDLAWDSMVIGRRMGAITHFYLHANLPCPHLVAHSLICQISEYAAIRGVECLVCKTYTDDILAIHALEANNFFLMDTLLDYVYDLNKFPIITQPQKILKEIGSIRLANSEDIDGMKQVAATCFRDHFGRYHSDNKIPKKMAKQVYIEWVKASLAGYADWIFIAEIDNMIAGYSIWKKPSHGEMAMSVRVGHYSIAAVHPDFSGRKLFGALTFAGMQRFEGFADFIKGPTHINNYPVQRAYANLMWQIADARHSFHRWIA